MGRKRRGHQSTQRPEKAEEKRKAQFADAQRKLDRRRNIIGALVLIPLAAVLLNVPFGPLDVFGIPPREGWLLVWAMLFGSFLGLTIRIVLERRKFR